METKLSYILRLDIPIKAKEIIVSIKIVNGINGVETVTVLVLLLLLLVFELIELEVFVEGGGVGVVVGDGGGL